MDTKELAPQTKPLDLITLAKEANVLLEKLIEAGGEISPELESALQSIDVSLPKKVDGYGFLLDRLTKEAQFWQEKSDLYAAVAKSTLNFQARMKDRIKIAMEIMRQDEVRGFDVRFKMVRNSQESLAIDERALPRDWTMEVVTRVPDKERIKEAIKSGKTVTGCVLTQGYHVRKFVNREK